MGRRAARAARVVSRRSVDEFKGGQDDWRPDGEAARGAWEATAYCTVRTLKPQPPPADLGEELVVGDGLESQLLRISGQVAEHQVGS